jgi:hypothetical protein
MSEVQIPWWAKATPAVDQVRVRLADLWDALFGRIETYFKVELDGSFCIVESRDLFDFANTADSSDNFIVTAVHMTRRQFNSLPEFAGF